VPPTCYLHVGGYKTGTTYLQRRLIDGRAALRESGVLVPGTKGIGEHVRAGKMIMGRLDLRGQPIPERAWYALRDEMLAFDGHSAVYSYEELCAATKEQARRMVNDLGTAEVRIVLTVRDLVRVIPAAWQEVVQGGQQWTWDQFVSTIMSRAGRAIPPARTFWRNHDMVAVASRWADAVGPDRVTIVTVPPSDAPSHVLWDRFCAAVNADASVVPPDPGVDNESLDMASAELLRRLNVRAADVLPVHLYDREVKWFVAKEVLAARSGPDRVHLEGAAGAWARAQGVRMADGLRELGVRVEGDLADLVGTPVEGAPSAAASADELLDAALDVITALVTRLGERPRPGGAAPPVAAAPTPTARARKLAGRLLRESYDRTHR
jgi:hypothetical protein